MKVLKGEIWQDIEGYEGLYKVSNLGRVMSIKSNIVLSNEITKKGYCRVALYNKKFKKKILVHRLVAKSFVPNPYNKPFINHKDADKSNNIFNNLEWCTQSENERHAWDNELKKRRFGEENNLSKLDNEDVINIRMLYDNGRKVIDISKTYNVTENCIYGIIKKKSWSHI